ncbi:MAG: SIR2 family protein [Candidatus Omnitrophica bacterium]|nr:SIR2 family protein [Candidatus Omnitrophota bacterium]
MSNSSIINPKGIFFANDKKLLHRLVHSAQNSEQFTFLLGSGLTVPVDSPLGVSSVEDIISEIKQKLSSSSLDDDLKVCSKDQRYKIAMRTLLQYRGQNELNKLIIKSVLKARITKETTFTPDNLSLQALEKDVINWYLRPGVDYLGKLCVEFFDRIGSPILTSNFDPLIEVSIRKHQGKPLTTPLSTDGKIYVSHEDAIIQVVHFHGYWHGEDTLHTENQITRDRPKLEGSLRSLLCEKTLVVAGYGGWNDIFIKILIRIMSEGSNKYNIIWTFYDEEEDVVLSKYSNLINSFGDALGQRIVLYKGVDLDKFIPNLYKQIKESVNSEDQNQISIGQHDNINISEKPLSENIFISDIPPNVDKWVGRVDLLNQVSDDESKIVCLSGIGGQGKSSLASYFIRNLNSLESKWEYWDWRDFREEGNRIHTILISIIERLTDGKFRSGHFINDSIDELIDRFFYHLAKRKVVFVFDNVDHYVDLERFEFNGGLGKLFDEALRQEHNSKFIFTCRPYIQICDNYFLQIDMPGLSIDESIDLFKKYSIPMRQVELTKIINELHALTKGHPLWLNLMAAQASRGKVVLKNFIERLKDKKSFKEKDFSSILAESTLRTVWETLNEKQKILLRGMSETVKAETKEHLSKIIESELNYNQFSKALKALITLNLIVTKSSTCQNNMYELHPLVKEYVWKNFSKQERVKYITLFVKFYDQVIAVLKPKLSHESPLSVFENWTSKIELEINKDDYKSALTSLQEVATPILTAGYVEEYIRITHLFFLNVDWLKAVYEEYKYFHDQYKNFIKSLIEIGKFDEADNFLKKYVKTISGKGVNYIHFCNLRAYFYWYKGDFVQAIMFGEKGLDLKKSSKVDGNFDIDHTLALAYRDSRENGQIERALEFFLKGIKLNDVLSRDIDMKDYQGSYFGNIGRCLDFLGKPDEALKCYAKSLVLLNRENDSSTSLNRGYACQWIAENLLKIADTKTAYYFFNLSIFYWIKVSPVRAERIKRTFLVNELFVDLRKKEVSDWENEKKCKEWLQSFSSVG